MKCASDFFTRLLRGNRLDEVPLLLVRANHETLRRSTGPASAADQVLDITNEQVLDSSIRCTALH